MKRKKFEDGGITESQDLLDSQINLFSFDSERDTGDTMQTYFDRKQSPSLPSLNQRQPSSSESNFEYIPSSGDADRDTIANLLSAKESGGDYKALPKRKDGSLVSSAVGKYQFLWGVHGKDIAKVTGAKTKDEFMNNPKAQEDYFTYYYNNSMKPAVQKYKTQLERIIPNVSEVDVAKAYHFAGPGNLEKAIASGDINRPLDGFGSSIVSYLGRKKHENGGIAMGLMSSAIPTLTQLSNTILSDNTQPVSTQRQLSDSVNPYNKFENGGMVRNNVPIEVEGNEYIQTPNGVGGMLKGPSHSEGGIDLNVPENTRIYSDKIKIGDKTMAERKERREKELTKLEKKMIKNPFDKLLADTLKRTKEVLTVEDEQDMEVQLNQQQVEQQEQQELPQFATGGIAWDDIVGKNLGYPLSNVNLMAGLGTQGQLPPSFAGPYKKPFDTTGLLNTPTFNSMPNVPKFYNTNSVNNTVPTNTNTPNGSIVNFPFNRVEGSIPFTTDGGLTTASAGPSIPFTTNSFVPTAMSDNVDTTTNNTTAKTKGNRSNGKGLGLDMGTMGASDYLGVAGNILGGIAPLLNTLANARNSRPSENTFSSYGERGLRELDGMDNALNLQRADVLTKLNQSLNTSKASTRANSNSINMVRALDTAAQQGYGDSLNDLMSNYLGQLGNIKAQRASMMNNMDQVKMQAQDTVNERNVADIDAMYSNLGQDYANLGTNMMGLANNLSTNRNNRISTDMLNQMSQYFDLVTENGKIVLKPKKKD